MQYPVKEIPQRCDYQPNDMIDHYKIVSKLGEGSFGVVYKAEDSQQKVIRALKLLKLWTVTYEDDREAIANRFLMEFETGKIASNYLVHTHAHGKIQGNPYLVMHYCPNGDLRKYLGKHLPEEQTNNIAIHVLRGLADLHLNGKVHRDLKPENVLFDENERALLTDFGISGDKNHRMTKVNVMGKPKEIFGTYAYMPPEQWQPVKNATVLPTTDIFSFGVVMYELFTGNYPFGTINSNAELADYIKKKSAKAWDKEILTSKGISRQWVSIIDKCLEPDFKQRFQSVGEILAMLSSKVEQDFCLPGSPVYHFHGDNLALQVMQGEQYGTRFSLSDLIPNGECGIIRVGRKDTNVNNDISIKEQLSCYISRNHATIEKDEAGEQWLVRDGQWLSEQNKGYWKRSTNGTFVNSHEVSDTGMPIVPGDIISIGDVKLKVIRV
jgi:serine/threonine protein kinase